MKLESASNAGRLHSEPKIGTNSPEPTTHVTCNDIGMHSWAHYQSQSGNMEKFVPCRYDHWNEHFDNACCSSLAYPSRLLMADTGLHASAKVSRSRNVIVLLVTWLQNQIAIFEIANLRNKSVSLTLAYFVMTLRLLRSWDWLVRSQPRI